MSSHADARERMAENLQRTRAAIAAACARSGRDAAGVALLAVTKYVDAATVRRLYDCGVRDFGESTVQGTVRKLGELGELAGARWHLLGHLQRNKVKRALELFVSIHSLDSRRLAEALDARLRGEASAPPPRLFVEVNVGGEKTKSGVAPAELTPLLEMLQRQTVLGPHLAGLMTVAPRVSSPEDVRPFFRALRELRDRARDGGLLPADAGLSMGMSEDFPFAVEEGATVVRLGSCLFEGLA